MLVVDAGEGRRIYGSMVWIMYTGLKKFVVMTWLRSVGEVVSSGENVVTAALFTKMLGVRLGWVSRNVVMVLVMLLESGFERSIWIW